VFAGDQRHGSTTTAFVTTTASTISTTTATTATTITTAATATTTAEPASESERPEPEKVGQSVGGVGRRVRRVLVPIRDRATLRELLLFNAARRRQQARAAVGDRSRVSVRSRSFGRQPGGVLVVE